MGKDYSGGMEIKWIFLKEVRFGLYSFEVFLPGEDMHLPKDSKVKCNQIRTIDKKRLINFVGALLPEKLEKALFPKDGFDESNPLYINSSLLFDY